MPDATDVRPTSSRGGVESRGASTSVASSRR